MTEREKHPIEKNMDTMFKLLNKEVMQSDRFVQQCTVSENEKLCKYRAEFEVSNNANTELEYMCEFHYGITRQLALGRSKKEFGETLTRTMRMNKFYDNVRVLGQKE